MADKKWYWERDDWKIEQSLPQFEFLLDLIPEGETILDDGSGPCLFYGALKQAGRTNEYLGIDIDQNYLTLGQQIFPDVQVRHTDAFFLPEEWTEGFDTVLLNTLVDSVADYRKPLDEAYRVAKKRMIATVFYPLTDLPDRNYTAVAEAPYYVMRLNKKKLVNYLKTFEGKLISGKSPDYYWWMVEK